MLIKTPIKSEKPFDLSNMMVLHLEQNSLFVVLLVLLINSFEVRSPFIFTDFIVKKAISE